MEVENLIRAIIAGLVVFGVALVIFFSVRDTVSKHAGLDINQIVTGGFVMWGFGNRKKTSCAKLRIPFQKIRNAKPRKKGIVLTTTLMASIIFFIVVAFILFLILASLGGEAGRGANSFFYGIFDAIVSSLPWVS